MNEEDHTQHLDEIALAKLGALSTEAKVDDSSEDPQARVGEPEPQIDLAMLDRLAAMAEGRIARPAPAGASQQPARHPNPSPVQDVTRVMEHPAKTLVREAPARRQSKQEAPARIEQVPKLGVQPMPPAERSKEPWSPPPRMVMPVDPAKVREIQRSPWRPIAIFSSVLVLILIAIVVYLLVEGLPWGASTQAETMAWMRL